MYVILFGLQWFIEFASTSGESYMPDAMCAFRCSQYLCARHTVNFVLLLPDTQLDQQLQYFNQITLSILALI